MSGIDNLTSGNDLLDRLSYMTEELERLISLSRGEQIGSHRFGLAEVQDSLHGHRQGKTPLGLYRMVRLALLHNLVGASIMYRAGKRLGKESAPGSVRAVAAEVERLGLGQLVIEPDLETPSILHLSDCAACAGLSRGDDPVCHLEAGLLAGMLEAALERDVDVRETRCIVTGGERCTFEVQHRPAGGLDEMVERVALDYSAENIKLLSTLASHAMSALENAILYEKTKRLVVVDGLTYTYNRHYFEERLREEFQRASRHHHPLSLLMLDIDKFKSHNDAHGHPHGDRVLRGVARVLKDNLRGIDVVARFGGDEFAIILPQTDTDGVKIVTERVRTRVAALKLVEPQSQKEVSVTVSVGAATFPSNASNPEELLSQADQALYRAKQLGGNRTCMFLLAEVS
jgi:diguanylate cyclase (GGDEF)-like protein